METLKSSVILGSTWVQRSPTDWCGEFLPPSVPANPFGDDFSVGKVFEDRRGRLWVSQGERICHADVGGVDSAAGLRWDCDDLEGVRDILDIAEAPDGEIWASGWGGLWRWNESAWSVHPAAQKLPTTDIRNVYRKLQVHSVAEAVARALREKLV